MMDGTKNKRQKNFLDLTAKNGLEIQFVLGILLLALVYCDFKELLFFGTHCRKDE